jgi:hypothetical protein
MRRNRSQSVESQRRSFVQTVLVALILAAPTQAAAAPVASDSTAGPRMLFYPEGPRAGENRWGVGGIWQISPLDASLESIILYSQLGVGAQWAAHAGPFSLGLTAEVAGYFGTLGKALVATTSFNTTGWGLLLDPGLKAGLQLTRDSWFTLQFQMYLSLAQAVNLGGLVLSPGASSYAGFGLSALVEYAPTRQSAIYYGVSLYHTATNYPAFFNVEATPTSEAPSADKIWYLGVLGGYEF